MYLLGRRRLFRQRTALLRGARRLRLEGEPYFVYDALKKIQPISLGVNLIQLGKVIPDLDPRIISNRIRQKLLWPASQIYRKAFVALGTGQRANIGIPIGWAECLNRNGIPTNLNGSRRALHLLSLTRFIGAVLFFLHLLSQYRLLDGRGKPYIAFGGLAEGNFPSKRSHEINNLISWFQQSGLRDLNGCRIVIEVPHKSPDCTSRDVDKCSMLIPKQPNVVRWLVFFYKGIGAIVRAFFCLIAGQWWRGIILREELEAKYVSTLPPELLAREYFFNQSQLFDKRLWLEIAELRESKVTCYWYSANIQNFWGGQSRASMEPLLAFTLNWKNIIVWDGAHEKFIRRFSPNASFEQCGYIELSDNGQSFSLSDTSINIAVFDVSASRPLLIPEYSGYAETYYTSKLIKQFGLDLAWVASTLPNVAFHYKKKRHEPTYRVSRGSRIDDSDIFSRNGIYRIDVGVSAKRLIDSCDAVIVMPFSSPAIIGKYIRKPTIYYDPSGTVKLVTQRGIPLIGSRDQLKDWLKREFVEKLTKGDSLLAN